MYRQEGVIQNILIFSNLGSWLFMQRFCMPTRVQKNKLTIALRNETSVHGMVRKITKWEAVDLEMFGFYLKFMRRQHTSWLMLKKLSYFFINDFEKVVCILSPTTMIFYRFFAWLNPETSTYFGCACPSELIIQY